jgi:hypothetical protein
MSDKCNLTTLEECYRRAATARYMADVASRSRMRAYFLALEDRWRSRSRDLQSRRDPNITLALAS